VRSSRVAIVIVNLDSFEHTAECLESLGKIHYSAYDIVVLDNGSSGNDAERLHREYGDRVHVLNSDKNLGFAGANNLAVGYALKHLNPDYVLLLNNDTVVDPDFLTQLVRADERIGGRAVCGPKVLMYYQPDTIAMVGGKLDWWRGCAPHIGAGKVDAGQYDTPRAVDYIEASCLLAHTETWLRVGPLDPQYYPVSWEDVDWCIRARALGYRILCVPSAKIWHKVGASYSGAQRLYTDLKTNLLFMRKHASRPRFLTFLCWFIFYTIPAFSARLFPREPMAVAQAVWKSITWNIRNSPVEPQAGWFPDEEEDGS